MRRFSSPILLGLLASFFFSLTFILNRSMDLGGGFWVWSGVLRYVFMAPLLAVLVPSNGGWAPIFAEVRRAPASWWLWSTVGFGLFYAPVCWAAAFGEGWLVAGLWQVTIVAGTLLFLPRGRGAMEDPGIFHADFGRGRFAAGRPCSSSGLGILAGRRCSRGRRRCRLPARQSQGDDPGRRSAHNGSACDGDDAAQPSVLGRPGWSRPRTWPPSHSGAGRSNAVDRSVFGSCRHLAVLPRHRFGSHRRGPLGRGRSHPGGRSRLQSGGRNRPLGIGGGPIHGRRPGWPSSWREMTVHSVHGRDRKNPGSHERRPLE